MCMNFIIPLIEKEGFSVEDPQKAEKVQEYKECLAAEGLNQAAIEAELAKQEAADSILGGPVPGYQDGLDSVMLTVVISIVGAVLTFLCCACRYCSCFLKP